MVKIDKPIRENYPNVFEAFDYMELGFWVLTLIAIVTMISILLKFLSSYGIDDSRDLLHPGLRFPPGHYAHQMMLVVLYLIRFLGVIIVITAFVEGFDFSLFMEMNYWDFFVLGLLPAFFWFGFFLVLGEWFKFQWMGSVQRWEEYIDAYSLEVPEPDYSEEDYYED